eukprot:2158439-Amphidinium_carterae.1
MVRWTRLEIPVWSKMRTATRCGRKRCQLRYTGRVPSQVRIVAKSSDFTPMVGAATLVRNYPLQLLRVVKQETQTLTSGRADANIFQPTSMQWN